MTPRQKEIYDWIVSETLANRPPTVREIGNHFGIANPNGVVCHLNALQKKGRIRRNRGKGRNVITRGIEVVSLEREKDLREAVFQAALRMVDLGDDYAFDELKRAVKEYRAV